MLYRYGKHKAGYNFSGKSERYHMPTLKKAKLKDHEYKRVVSFGSGDKNYQKFTRTIKPGDDVWVVIYDKKIGRYCVKKSTICSIFFFNYDKDGHLWNVWLDNYYHNTGLKEDAEYFLTKERAYYFLNHKMTEFNSYRENVEYWKKFRLANPDFEY